jgi:MoaA/NifB/PqqE/SkfB family radical SAM enzyme
MTDACNLECRGCRRAVIGLPRSNEISVETVERLLELYPEIAFFSIAGLGEPTLCPGFTEVVDYLKEKGKAVAIVTNGTNAAPFISLKNSPDDISISLYGYDRSSYEKNCGVGCFEKVTSNFRKLRQRFDSVGFSYILTKDGYEDLENVLALTDELEPDFLDLVNYLAYDPDNDEETSRIILSKDGDIIDFVTRKCSGREYLRAMPVYVDPEEPLHKCRSYLDRINVDGAGNVGGCQRQVPPAELYGNIHGDDDPFESPEMNRLRDLQRNGLRAHEACRFCFGDWGP